MQNSDAHSEWLKKLQDPTTKEGFWNLFAGLWGVAQSQPGFNYKDWLAVKSYVERIEAIASSTSSASLNSSSEGPSGPSGP